jgi:hypothetical protein
VADVMTKCPYTGKDIRTGFHAADQQSFEDAQFQRTIVDCPACGRLHEWSKDDAFLSTA